MVGPHRKSRGTKGRSSEQRQHQWQHKPKMKPQVPAAPLVSDDCEWQIVEVGGFPDPGHGLLCGPCHVILVNPD